MSDSLHTQLKRLLVGSAKGAMKSKGGRTSYAAPLWAWLQSVPQHKESRVMALVPYGSRYRLARPKSHFTLIAARRISAKHHLTYIQEFLIAELISRERDTRTIDTPRLHIGVVDGSPNGMGSDEAAWKSWLIFEKAINATGLRRTLPLASILDPALTNLLLLVQLHVLVGAIQTPKEKPWNQTAINY